MPIEPRYCPRCLRVFESEQQARDHMATCSVSSGTKTTLFEFRGQRRVVLLAGFVALASIAYSIAKLVLQ